MGSRRDFLLHSLCGCALSGFGRPAQARILPTDLPPLVAPGYRPVDADERGLWQACEELEKELEASKLTVDDPALKSYLLGVMQRLLGTRAAELRVFVLRDPDFNASMAPNGMMMVYTGLLARVRSEAQLAAVLGHESGHYLRRHTLQNWRRIKARTAAMSVVEVLGAFTGVGALVGLGINATLALSLYSYSRELESEADAFGLQLLKAAGYPPEAAAEVWKQLIGERQASAVARHKKYRDTALSALSTHPPTEERMRDLIDTVATFGQATGSGGGARRDELMRAITPLRASLLEEQVRLNDPGASLYLLASLAQDGWNGLLRYYEGEVYRLRAASGDDALAARDYAAATQFEDAPAEAFRQHGYALLRAGSTEEGRRALQRYLERMPQAADADMVRFTLSH
jgi:beta-barrel assembly-enhancing protease